MLNYINTLKIFFDEPTKEFNVREIARILDIAPATASKELKQLKNENFLKENKLKNFTFYKANIENTSYKDLKIYYIINKIKESGLIEGLNKFYLKPTIVLFGSSRYGLDTESSDIDLLIISEKKSDFINIHIFEKKLKRKIQLFIVKNQKELKNDHLINNVLNGIVLQGEIKWI